MKYLVYDGDQIRNEMIYCNKNGNETSEDIARAIVTNNFIDSFVAKDHQPISRSIKNDDNMFILRDINNHMHIWQICGKISDYNNTIIPNLYRVRKVGVIFN